jgi:hypothetical protein
MAPRRGVSSQQVIVALGLLALGTLAGMFACDPGPPTPSPPQVRCGGIAAFPCPGAGICLDDPSDSCDPKNGGADCGGLCSCAPNKKACPKGQIWNGNPTVCACVPEMPGPGATCGQNTCAADQFCCNASCGICAAMGGACIQIACEAK